MECFECVQSGVTRKAVGLCHHCSAALCAAHIFAVEDPLRLSHIMTPSVVLPKRARILLCATCKAAMEQPAGEEAEFEHATQ